MSRGVHRPSDFLAPPSELPVAGAPSPAAFRRTVKRRVAAAGAPSVDAAWRVDREIDRLLAGRLLHLAWALGVQTEAAGQAGVTIQARGWLAGTAVAGALGLVGYDPVVLGLSGADGLPEKPQRAARLTVAASPENLGDAAAWFLEWGRRRRRRFTVALVAPGGRLLPFDWDDVRALAKGPSGESEAGRERGSGRVRPLTLAWVPDERVVQVPWGETADGFPVALLPDEHLQSSGVHLVELVPDELLGAVARRRPAAASERGALSRAVRSADDPAAFETLAGGWVPPAAGDAVGILSELARAERPSTFEDLVVLCGFAFDEVRRGYFLERFQARRGRPADCAPELPAWVGPTVEASRGVLVFEEQVAALLAVCGGLEPERAQALAGALASGSADPDEAAQVWERAAQRGMEISELDQVRLAVTRWAPLALSKRDAAIKAAMIYELALLKDRSS